MKFFRSLRLKLLLAFILVVAVAGGTVAYIATRSTRSQFSQFVSSEQAMRYKAQVRILAQYYRFADGWEGVDKIVSKIGETYNDRIVLTNPDGEIISDTGNSDHRGTVSKNLKENSISAGIGNPPVGILYFRSKEKSPIQQAFLESVTRSVMIGASAAGAVAILLGIILSSRMIKPIKAITEASKSMKEGDLKQRVEVSSGDEIGELADSFNSMASNLSEQERLRQNMVSDISHELRSPLSNIKGYLEGLKDGVLEPDRDLFDSLYQESRLLERLVDDLHDLSMAEAGQLNLDKKTVSLEDVISESLGSISSDAEEKDLQIEADIENSLLVCVDPARIGEVLRNLLTNAVRYSEEGGKIKIRARKEGGEVVLSVSDSGEGIPDEDIPYVFDRFYRVDKSRSRSTGGSGLGLTIAREIVEAHEGEIWVESEEGRGSTFTFSLPALEEEGE